MSKAKNSGIITGYNRGNFPRKLRKKIEKIIKKQLNMNKKKS